MGRPDGGLDEPGRFSRTHGGDAYGCCVPALTRFASHHCPGPPRLPQTPATWADVGPSVILRLRTSRSRPRSENRLAYTACLIVLMFPWVCTPWSLGRSSIRRSYASWP